MQQYCGYWTNSLDCGRRFDQDLVQRDGSLQTLTLTSYFDGGEQCNPLNIPTNIYHRTVSRMKDVSTLKVHRV
jgi:hypothetical protein